MRKNKKTNKRNCKKRNETKKVYMDYGDFNKIFIIGAIISILFFFFACLDKQYVVGIMLFLLFGILSFPFLLIQKLYTFEFNSEKFSTIIFLKRKDYSYIDIKEICFKNYGYILKLNNGKNYILFIEMVNVIKFHSKIIEKCGKDIIKENKETTRKPLPFSMVDIVNSYNNGIFKEALIITNKETKKEFKIYKKFHKFLIIFYCLSLILLLYLLGIDYENNTFVFSFFAILTNSLMFIYLFLYFKKPQIFTMREQPKNIEHIYFHKLSTIAATSLISFFCDFVFFADYGNFYTETYITNNILYSIIFGLILIYFLSIKMFKKFSYEYKNYRIGLISFITWFTIYMIGFFFFFTSIIDIFLHLFFTV